MTTKKPARKAAKKATAEKQAEAKQPTLVEQVRLKELQNIKRKLESGKTLSTVERRLVKEYDLERTGNKPLEWNELAEKLGVGISTIKRRRREGGAPTTPDPDQWREYLNKTVKRSGPMAGEPTGDMAHLRARLTQEQTRKEAALASLRELELSMKENQLVPESDLAETMAKLLTPLRRLLDALPRAAAAQANPAKPMVAEKAIRQTLDDRVFGELEKVMKAMGIKPTSK